MEQQNTQTQEQTAYEAQGQQGTAQQIPPYGASQGAQGQPYQAAQPYVVQQLVTPGRGAATASLVLGIIGCVFFWFFYLAAILGLIGLCLAISAKHSGNKSGAGTAGLILSLIALLIGGGMWIYGIITLRQVAGQIDYNNLLKDVLEMR